MANDGTDANNYVAEIRAEIGGTPGANDTPGDLVFSTTADGANSLTQRMAILANGNIDLAGNLLMNANEIIMDDNSQIQLGSSQDLKIYHDASNSYVQDTGTGHLILGGSVIKMMNAAVNEDMIVAQENAAVKLMYNNAKKFETTVVGVTVTGTIIATTDTDTSNTGNVTLDFAANQNFVLTLTGNTTLVNPTTEQVGQSGFIAFIQDGTGGRTITLGDQYETAGGVGISLTTAASATDLVPYVVVAAGRILLGQPQKAFS